jgi:hypothetical protein
MTETLAPKAADFEAAIAPISAQVTATLIPAEPAETKPTPSGTQAKPVIDCGTFDDASSTSEL